MKHILLLTAVATFTLTIPFTAKAQTKTKKNVVPSKTITTQTAITEDGRKALLKSNGTWEYGKNDVVVPAKATKENSTLKFETGIVLKSGDVKPVSRNTFYLLDKSFASIVIDEGHASLLTTENQPTKESVYGIFLLVFGSSISAGGYGRYQNIVDSVMSAIKPHVIKAVTTDFGGKATLNELPSGKYWLMGFSTINKDCIIWDIETNLSSGDNSLILDQNNAANFSDLGICL